MIEKHLTYKVGISPMIDPSWVEFFYDKGNSTLLLECARLPTISLYADGYSMSLLDFTTGYSTVHSSLGYNS